MQQMLHQEFNVTNLTVCYKIDRMLQIQKYVTNSKTWNFCTNKKIAK